MMKRKILLVAFLICSGASFAQNIDSRISAVYGSSISQLNAAQIGWLDNCLERSEIISLGDVPQASAANMTMLSAVPLQTKFAAPEQPEAFNPTTFNPLIYAIDYFRKTDQYFRIDQTDFVLKIHKKED